MLVPGLLKSGIQKISQIYGRAYFTNCPTTYTITQYDLETLTFPLHEQKLFERGLKHFY